MTCSDGLSQWQASVSTHMPHLSKPQATVLALWSFGMVLAQSCGLTSVAWTLARLLGCRENTMRQRLRELVLRCAPQSGQQPGDQTRNVGCDHLFSAAHTLGVGLVAARRTSPGPGQRRPGCRYRR